MFCTDMWPLAMVLDLLEARHFGKYFFSSKYILFLTDSMKISIFGGIYLVYCRGGLPDLGGGAPSNMGIPVIITRHLESLHIQNKILATYD